VSSHDAAHPDPLERRHVNAARPAIVALTLGVAVLVVCYLLGRSSQDGLRRFWLAYIHNYAYFLTLSLGALFFVMLQHLTRSGWSVVVRRPAEIMAANLVVLAILFVPIAINVAGGSGTAYPWAQPPSAFSHGAPADAAQAVEHNPAADHGQSAGYNEHADSIAGKRPFLNASFFIVRWIVYFAIWAGLARWFLTRSLRQDQSGDATLTLSMQRCSAPAMVAFALTVTLASFDLLMSLDPAWFSTIFGVYFFAGSVVGFLAALIVIVAGLQKRGVLAHSINAEHYHDMGKLLFAFVFFWGYIAFSQYMLMWYGNLPEETGWYFRRGCATQAPNVWSWVIVLILLGHFVVPFVFLLSRSVKRHRRRLVFWAVWMLVLHWIDLYWLVMPELTTTHLPLGPIEIGCLLGTGSVFVAGLAWTASRMSLLPVGDPRLPESLAFRNL
jgi:hypothetical protein